MALTRRLVFTKSLYDKLNEHKNRTSRLYLLGKNEKNIVCYAMAIQRNWGGCGYTRAASTKDITEAYQAVIKKGYQVAGIANLLDLNHMWYNARSWGGTFGHDPYRLPGLPFVVFGIKRNFGAVVSKHRYKYKVLIDWIVEDVKSKSINNTKSKTKKRSTKSKAQIKDVSFR